ncbi:MAG TPA: metallophosphoesterase [Acetobacteraceae bacterium]|nr:metallophosphoesterase [Acetobacteraceae bacterium]
MSRHRLSQNRGAGNRHAHPQNVHAGHGQPAHGNLSQHQLPQARQSHAAGSLLPVQNRRFVPQHFPFQPLPPPNGASPFHFDLTQLLHPDEVQKITRDGRLVFHTVGDTGDERGKEMDFVAHMMTSDYDASADGAVPAFFYHLGDVVYFAGDIDKYGACFYETYAEYPALIVAIPGNHDCQPDDPQDGPVDPNKKPLDGFVQNFMSKDPTQLGSLKTTSSRTQMNLPNVYWTFTTPFATIIGLFSNVGETEAELHQNQIDWLKSELKAADADKALIVAIHHPPFSGDTEHSGSTVSEHVLFNSFAETGVYPHMILSGHVHNYQRFTVRQQVNGKVAAIPCIVAGNGGYSKLGKLHKLHGNWPARGLQLSDTLTLETYDQDNFGFVRFEVTKDEIIGRYFSAPFAEERTPQTQQMDSFSINLASRTVS